MNISKNVLEDRYKNLKIKYDKLFNDTYPLQKKYNKLENKNKKLEEQLIKYKEKNKKLIEIRKILNDKTSD